MNKHMINTRPLWIAATLVLIVGVFAAAMLAISRLKEYPTLISEAYQGRLQQVEIPGEVDLELSRKGAFAVYYEEHEGAYIHAERPPRLDCNLKSKATGKDIPLVPDYEPTNRYVNKGGDRVGVLIYSTAVKEPGLHTLSCDYPDGRNGPNLTLAIGPNYFFEFLRVAWNLGGRVLGAVVLLLASVALSIGIASVAIFRKRKYRQVETETSV